MGLGYSLFSISDDSSLPIYRQLMEQVLRLTAAGVLVPGQKLPSVRAVARVLAVNPMTVSKSYGLLEMDGVLERIRGQGMRVAQRHTDGHAQREALLLPSMRRIVDEAPVEAGRSHGCGALRKSREGSRMNLKRRPE